MTWTTSASAPRALEKSGYKVFDYARLVNEYIEPVEQLGLHRTSLATAAAPLLALLAEYPAVAVLNVRVVTVGDLQRVYGYLVEPAYRRDCALRIQANVDLEQLRPDAFIEPYFGYAWTLERLTHLAARYERRSIDASLPPMTPIEASLYAAMQRQGLAPLVQFGIGPYRADFAFPERMLVVEADGRGWHDFELDRVRDRRLAERGWHTLRVSGSRIHAEADACAEEVARQYRRLPDVPQYSDLELWERKPSWWRRLLAWVRAGFRRKPARPNQPASQEADATAPELESQPDGLDPAQRAAVTAHEGVVQVIAPAGSGKTRVLVARVRELRSRGVPQERIMCATFNRVTAKELREKLSREGGDAVAVYTFHALGRHILEAEKMLRGEVGGLSFGEWRHLCRDAKEMEGCGVWIDPPDASEVISQFKLVDMIDPAEAGARALSAYERTAACLYDLYEKRLEEKKQNDYDDLVLNAVRLLQSDEMARRRWQGKWECVLVDEYQDIELAQELLVHLLAAPEDCLTVVGDEDQCIYTWRRAEVERIINLDKRFPGMERAVLTTCYRCPAEVVSASTQLITNNVRRFPKATVAYQPPSNDHIVIERRPFPDLSAAAEVIAQSLRQCDPRETVVLARTSRLLRTLAQACIAAGVPFSANDKVLRPPASEKVILAYLRLVANPSKAKAEDVEQALRVPNRYLPKGREQEVARRLSAGLSFSQAVALNNIEQFRRDALNEGGALLDQMAAERDAERIIYLLRTEGGLDKYFSDQERMSPHDQSEFDTLDVLQTESRGRTAGDVAQSIEERIRLLENSAVKDGVELVTMHGAKGREWQRVIIFGCDDDQIPHRRVLDEAARESDGDVHSATVEKAIEDERRLAYVALTRTKGTLELFFSDRNPSRFLAEAGLFDESTTPEVSSQPAILNVAPQASWTAAATTRRFNGRSAVPQPAPPATAPASSLRRTGRTMPSKYQSTCPACHNAIEIGDSICAVELDGRTRWIHDGCAEG